MRESIGGTWLMGFVVVFIILFSAFLVISINYSRAFKVKNKIIDIIEQNEGFDGDVEIEIGNYLDAIGYTISGTEAETQIDNRCKQKYWDIVDSDGDNVPDVDTNKDISKKGGYCLVEVLDDDETGPRHYKVTTFIRFEFPIIWQSALVPISGETGTIFPWAK